MARQEIRWRSNNGNLYSTEGEALKKDKEYSQIGKLKTLFKRETIALYELVGYWDEVKMIMRDNHNETD